MPHWKTSGYAVDEAIRIHPGLHTSSYATFTAVDNCISHLNHIIYIYWFEDDMMPASVLSF